MFTPESEIDLALRILLLGPLALLWILLVVRMIGLRSFSKMIAVDFVVTVATGSLLANAATASDWRAFVQACGAIAMLLASQALFTRLRRNSQAARKIENEPVILFRKGAFVEQAMAENRIARSDVIAKMREANALVIEDIHAVVLETTGDISVLHGGKADDLLLEDIAMPPASSGTRT